MIQVVFKRNILYIVLQLLLAFSINGQQRAHFFGHISDQFGILPGASISIEGTNMITTSDVNGFYSFDVEEGDYVVSASFVMYTPLSKSITLNVGDTIQLDFKLETGFSIDQPISLGSRDKPQSLLQTTAPVDIISPQDIENSSQLELSQILHYFVPSFHSTPQTISDGTDHIDPTSLRGLGPDQVLVLVNGKRRHSSSLLNLNGTVGRGTVGTDFNAIPVSAIERIEILRDGATSQYGSDAIAGVINIILKKQIEAINVDVRTGINSEGDGQTNYFGTNFGLKIGNNGFVNVTGEYRNREATNRAGNYTGTIYSNDPIEDQQLIEANNFFHQTGYSDQRVMEIGSAETRNLALFFNGEFRLSDNSEFYFHGGRNYREGKAKGFYRFPKDQDRVVLDLYPNGFSPQILTDIQDNSIVSGIRGKVNGWNADFSHSIGNNSLDYTINNSNNASMGASSPRTFYSGGFLYNQNITDLNFSRTFDWLSDITLAFGAELRVENYRIISGEEASYINGDSTYIDNNGIVQTRVPGAQVFPGIHPNNELSRFRTNSAAYIDIETNLNPKLLIKAAARHEFYNDFGGQTVWKLSSRYKIDDKTSFRIGYSTGFRAPSLHQVYFQNISTQIVDGEILEVGTFSNQSALTTEGFQIQRLKPELSTHFSSGITRKFNSNFSLSFDYYLININDRIVLSSQINEGYETILDVYNVSTAQFFTNAIDSKTSGADITLYFKQQLRGGELNATLGANYSLTKVIGKAKSSSPLFTDKEDDLFDRGEIGRIESAQPNSKVNLALSYEFKRVQFILTNTYFGELKFVHPDDGNPNNWVFNEISGIRESRDQTFSAKIVSNFSFCYQFSHTVKFVLGSNNLFNIYPDKHKHSANINNGNFVYSRRVQQFGVNGRNFFTSLSFRL